MTGFNVRVGLHIEEVDGTVLVLDPSSSTVLELTGDQAEAFRLAESGATEVPARLTTAMAALVELDLVTAPGWDRRRVLLAGGVAAAAAVVAIALPTPVAAQSGGGGGPVTPTAPDAPTITSVTRPDPGSISVAFTPGNANGFIVIGYYLRTGGVINGAGPSSPLSGPNVPPGTSIQVQVRYIVPPNFGTIVDGPTSAAVPAP